MYESAPGATSQSYQVFLRDSTTAQGKVGLTALSAGARGGYVRQAGTGVDFALVPLVSPTDPWVSGGFCQIDPVRNKGMYRVDVPDAAHAAGANFFSLTLNFDGTSDEGVLVLLRQAANLVGPGAYSHTVTLQKADTTPIAGAAVWASTDASGTNVIAGSLVSSQLGTVTFLLNAGDYYLWVNAVGYAPANPYQFSVSGAGGQTVTLAVATAPPSLVQVAGHEPRVTAFDVERRLLDFGGAVADEKNARGVRQAVLDAMREFATLHAWTYLRSLGRLTLHAPYSTGTVTYTATGGTYERMLVLDGGTWPTWAAVGYVRVAGIVAKVASRVNDTVLTLKDPTYIGDVAAGSGYTLYQDTYTLPADFVASDHALAETCWGRLSYIRPAEWLGLVRHQESTGTPAWWTVTGDPDVPGRLAMRLYPAPDADGTLDYLYQRKPRAVSVFDLSTGTASLGLADASLVTLSAAVLKASMVGSVIRLAQAAGDAPDGPAGVNPYAFEGNITSVLSATQCRVDNLATEEYAAVAYRISDPVDAEDLQQLVLGRGAEKAFAMSRLLKSRGEVHAAWVDALQLAKEGDSRVMGRQAEGGGRFGYGRLLRERGAIDFTA